MKVVGLSLVLALFGCSKSRSSGDALSGNRYFVVNSDDLVKTESSISGTGSVVFNTPLSEVASKTNYKIAFTLEDSGSLALVSNASNTLTSGISVKFSRSGSSLKVTLVSDSGTTDVSNAFAGIELSATLSMQIDVHNNESPAHILVWDGGVTDYSDSSARLNSEDTGLEAPGKGTGSYWGLVLSKAHLTEATAINARFSEPK